MYAQSKLQNIWDVVKSKRAEIDDKIREYHQVINEQVRAINDVVLKLESQKYMITDEKAKRELEGHVKKLKEVIANLRMRFF